MFSETQLKSFGNRLKQRIADLEADASGSAQQRKTVTLDQQSVGRLSRMDALQQQAMAQATDRRRRSEITRAQSALRAIGSDEFGYCAECGEPIELARFEHDPALTLCFSCAKGR
jgi:DnaK suppressor protein